MFAFFGFYAALGVFAFFIVALLLWPMSRKNTGIALLFLVLCGGLYALAGTPRFAWEQAQREAKRETNLARIHNIETQLATQPESPKLWAELGEANLQAGRAGLAMQAFQQQVLLSKGAPDALLNYGRAQVLAANGEVTDKAAETFRMALLQTDDAQARLFLAIHAAHHGEAKKALAELKKLEDAPTTPVAVRAAALERQKSLEKQ